MSKVVTVGATALFACILCATPLSLRLSPEGNVALSVDSASAVIGRPLTPGSVAGVHRRAHRRAYRHGYYGNYGYGYGTYQPSYGYGVSAVKRTRVTRISRPPAMAITSNPILGMAPGIGNGGSSDRAISILEKPHGPLACSGLQQVWLTKPPRSN